MRSIVKSAWTTMLLYGKYKRTNSRIGEMPRCRTTSDARSALGVLLEVYMTLSDDMDAKWVEPSSHRHESCLLTSALTAVLHDTPKHWGFSSGIKNMDWDTGETYWLSHQTCMRFPEHVCEWAGMKRIDLGEVVEWMHHTNSHKKIAPLIEDHIDDEDHSSDWI